MKKIGAWLLFVGGLSLVAMFFIWGVTIRQVHCVLNDHEISQEFKVCAQLQTLIGSRLLWRDFYRDSSLAALLHLPETQEIFDIQKVEKSLSGQITLYLSDQPPLYRIQQGEQQVLVTAAGAIRENNVQLMVPLVEDSANLYASEPAFHHFVAQFLASLADKQERVRVINLVSAERLEATLTNFPLVILELRQDPQLAARRLAVILDKLVPREIDLAARELDLRFELPVLRTTISSESASSESAQAVIDSQE